ncbi:MAG: excinuclease ABC subunit UvrC [Christensenellaceae bacterium]|nr:excinuclease ABC subunit UvrC [Christensenellaceae bacterium]
MKDLKEKLNQLPEKPGVYIMLDKDGQIIYVGKAKILKNRVKQYFHSANTLTEKTVKLVEKIEGFRYIITNSETEALVLENNLIKEHKPHYNILLKDSKSYPYIRINLKDKYPRAEIIRRLKADGAKYFGPYMVGISAGKIKDLLAEAFKLSTCSLDLTKKKKIAKPCLNYHLGKCLAPCAFDVSEEDYKREVKKATEFLSGDDNAVKACLLAKIQTASDNLQFEYAIVLRESLQTLDNLIRKQIINSPRDLNCDIFAFAGNALFSCVNFTAVRGGKVLGADNFTVSAGAAAEDALATFITQYYDKNPVVADEIIVSEALDFNEELVARISKKRGGKVNILTPAGGLRRQLLDLSRDNAIEYLVKQGAAIASKEARTSEAVRALQSELGLPTPPRRIECYDISHISGTDKAGSMVVFINGEAANKLYRRFKIKTVKGNDDFASMREVLQRRVAELASGDISFSEPPDLIVVDGGKGQLSYAYSVLAETGIPLISLAKREEEVFLPERSDPVILRKDGFPLMLLQRIRDEAHRFAITFNRNLRIKRQTESSLKTIKGVGDKRARLLLQEFKSVENLSKASVQELSAIDGMNAAAAQAVFDYYHTAD